VTKAPGLWHLSCFSLMPFRPTALLPLAIALLAGCRAQEPALPAASPQTKEIPGWEGVASTGAEISVEGGQEYGGPVSFRCVHHDEAGLQVNFRTGDPTLPVVAVRIADYRGGGPYSGALFLTARSGAGALVTSQGDVRLKVDQKSSPAAQGGEGVLLVSGSFKGSYRGAAGSGSIEGRFGDCPYSRDRLAPGAPAGALSPSEPEGGPDVGEDAPMP
jgi:hypothetical protein